MEKGEGLYLDGVPSRPRTVSSRRRRSDSHSFLTKDNNNYRVKGLSQSAKPSRQSHTVKRRYRLILQENSDDEDEFPPRMEKSLQELPSKNFPIITIPTRITEITDVVEEGIRSKILEENIVRKGNDRGSLFLQPVRKSSRIPKKSVPGVEHIGGDEEYQAPQPKKRRRSKSEIGLEELYQEEDDDEEAPSSDEDLASSDSEFDDAKERKQGITTYMVENKKEVPLTARQRTVQMCKVVDQEVTESLIEFPEGLPQTGQRKRQEKIPDFEQQLKKAEAARRRKIQAEKAAEEIQADAIKRILGQDSVKKKREEKLRKQRDEIAQEKAAAAKTIAAKSVRWVIGPSGTIVSFSEDAELLAIFNSVPCRKWLNCKGQSERMIHNKSTCTKESYYKCQYGRLQCASCNFLESESKLLETALLVQKKATANANLGDLNKFLIVI